MVEWGSFLETQQFWLFVMQSWWIHLLQTKYLLKVKATVISLPLP